MREATEIPTKPTKAMRAFLERLIFKGGRATPMEMSYPAYIMPLKMERAGWIKPVWHAHTIKTWSNPSVIWSRPKCWRITRDGRAAIAKAEPSR